MSFVPKGCAEKKAVSEKRNPEKDNVREEDNASLVQYSLLYSLFCLFFPLQGGDETERTEREEERVSAPMLVWFLFCFISPIYPIDIRSFSS